MPKDKRDNVLDVSIKEFGQKGYHKASTNEIVKNSGISKGLLFHYFGSKQNLYFYTLDYCTEFLCNELIPYVETLPNDIFKKVTGVGLKKLELVQKYPHMQALLLKSFYNGPEEFKEALNERVKKLEAMSMPLLLKDIDTSKFRVDISKEFIIEFIFLTLNSVSNKYVQAYKNNYDKIIEDYPKILEEQQTYIKLIKEGVFK